MIAGDHPKVGFAILRSTEDGHQTVGPPLRDRAGVRAYLAYIRGLPKQPFRVEGIVWMRDKPVPEGWGLWAEEIEPVQSSGSPFMLLRRGKR